MATIDLITYDQKMVTPKDDALIHQFGISNGVLYGCEVTLANSNTLHITGGQGVIYGRQWEIAEGDITVTLPASGSLKGRLYVKIDLSNTTNPIELLVQTAVTLPDLTDDDQINVDNSVSELEICTFDVSSLTISNLERTVEQVADGDHQDVVDLQADVSEIKSNLTQLTTPQTVPITVNDAAGVTVTEIVCYRLGRLVTFSATLNYTVANTNAVLCWVTDKGSSPHRPLSKTWLSCDFYNNNPSTVGNAEAWIDPTDAYIHIAQPNGGKNLKVSGCWITAE